MLDGLEITQFTYFQQCGGIELELVPAELTYGLERLAAFLQNVDSVYDIQWNETWTYRDVRFADEQQYSAYNFEKADVKAVWASLIFTKANAAACWTNMGQQRMSWKKPAFPCWPPTIKC